MHNISVYFELQTGALVPVGWKKSSGNLIWDVNMDFTQKSSWVKDGHRTHDPKYSNYVGVVSRSSARIALNYSALNEVDMTAAEIQSAYLQAPSSENHYVICEKYFGLENEGTSALIRRALYGGKFAGRDFCTHLISCMNFL